MVRWGRPVKPVRLRLESSNPSAPTFVEYPVGRVLNGLVVVVVVVIGVVVFFYGAATVKQRAVTCPY